VLVSTGTALASALEALERQTTDASWKHVISDVRSRVESGAQLSAAMAEHPQHFDAVARSLVAAGESAGNLPAMLDRLATLTRKQAHVRSAIIGAMVYPIVLVFVAVSVLVLLLTIVLPRFTELFKTLDTPLPPTTKLLMAASVFLRTYWWAVLLLIGIVVFSLRLWLKSDNGKRTLDTIALHLPKFGALIRSFSTARIARLLGILLQGKVALTEALELTQLSCRNHHYAELMGEALSKVTKGDTLASAFAKPLLISPSVHESIVSGERSGQLGTLLTTIADFMDETNEVTIRSLTSILEPLILIVLGVLVGFVALSMFIPLFDLTAATRGGG